MEDRLYFDTSLQDYSVEQNITLDKACNLLLVKNAGTSVLLFDLDPLQPGESKVIGGNRNEVLVGRHQVSFRGAGVNLAIVTQKYYVEPPKYCL
jgi:hypothetical protein